MLRGVRGGVIKRVPQPVQAYHIHPAEPQRVVGVHCVVATGSRLAASRGRGEAGRGVITLGAPLAALCAISLRHAPAVPVVATRIVQLLKIIF